MLTTLVDRCPDGFRAGLSSISVMAGCTRVPILALFRKITSVAEVILGERLFFQTRVHRSPGYA